MTRPELGCREAVALLAGWSGGAPDASLLAAAADHVSGCRVCQQGFDMLAVAVQSGLDDEISCAECEARLDAFYRIQSGGADAAAAMPIVDRHLATCHDCRATLAALADVVTALNEGTLPTADAYPEFDTGFAVAGQAPQISEDADERLAGKAVLPAVALLTDSLAARARESATRVTDAVRIWVDGADRDRPGGSEPPAWLRRLGPAVSTGALLPVVALLLIALAITWRSMQTAAPEPLPDATAAAATGTAAVRDMTATALAVASGQPKMATSTPDLGVLPAARATQSPTAPPAAETPTATATATRERDDEADRRDDDRREDRRPSKTPEVDGRIVEPEVTTVPGVPMETAYPRPATLSPPTAYPPPPTRWRPPTPLPTDVGRLPTAES